MYLDKWHEINAHHFSHMNTFVLVLVAMLLVSGALYGWRKVENVGLFEHIQESIKGVSKMVFCIVISAGISWLIDYCL